MSEEKDRVDGTADETKAETKALTIIQKIPMKKSVSCAADRRAKSRKDDYPSGKHQYLPGLHAEEL